jgi:phosphopantothenoylcysteine decarboxylase/phosphopantothenate--cysteine ligase
VLFQLSGSVAAFKACALISKLVQSGFEVQTAATASTFEFVGRATLEGLTGRPVFTDIFQNGRAMDHIHLAKWAELTILCPATANQINKLAAGIGDDAVSTLFLTHDFKKPYWVVPAMNEEMWLHPATQASLKVLGSWGVRVLEPAEGRQACGDVGPGRMLEPEVLLSLVEDHFKNREMSL